MADESSAAKAVSVLMSEPATCLRAEKPSSDSLRSRSRGVEQIRRALDIETLETLEAGIAQPRLGAGRAEAGAEPLSAAGAAVRANHGVPGACAPGRRSRGCSRTR